MLINLEHNLNPILLHILDPVPIFCIMSSLPSIKAYYAFSKLGRSSLVWRKMFMGRYVDMAWLGLAGTPYLYPCGPPGSSGGSDKTGFPDQGQIDSWAPEEDWWIWDWDGRRVPYTRGPLRDLQSRQNMLNVMIQIIWLGRYHYCGDNSIKNYIIIIVFLLWLSSSKFIESWLEGRTHLWFHFF